MSQRNQITKTCRVCGKHFDVPASWSYRVSCSHECNTAWRQIHPSNTGKTWFKKGVSASPTTQFQKGMRHTEEHKLMLRQKWKEGAYANRPRHSEETRKKIGAGLRNIPLNEWNGYSKPENKRARQCTAYKRWKAAVLERDGRQCQDCGTVSEKLEIHHILSFKKYPEQRFDINNGITYCRDCHVKNDPWIGRKDLTKSEVSI